MTLLILHTSFFIFSYDQLLVHFVYIIYIYELKSISYYLAYLTICVSVEYCPCDLDDNESLVSVGYEFGSSSSTAGK